MVFIPIHPPPSKNKKRNASLRTLQNRRNSIGQGSRMRQMFSNPFNTSQGVSTLTIVLIYSVVGMILNWVFPIVILEFSSEMIEEDAHYLGTVGAITITGVLLLTGLVNRFIFRSKPDPGKSKTRGINTDIFEQEDSKRKGDMGGR